MVTSDTTASEHCNVTFRNVLYIINEFYNLFYFEFKTKLISLMNKSDMKTQVVTVH